MLSEILGVDEDEITESAELKEDLGLDELDLVELVMQIEDTYRIQIDNESAESWDRVRDVFQYVDAHHGKK